VYCNDEVAFDEVFAAYLLAHSIRIQEELVDRRGLGGTTRQFQREAARADAAVLAHFRQEGKPETVIAKISQETLAEKIGTTRSRVSYVMNKFRKLGFINYNGDFPVHSSLLNVVLHD
jgi:CRP/FNR family cyclic AMP-dependent transcriptional regulator